MYLNTTRERFEGVVQEEARVVQEEARVVQEEVIEEEGDSQDTYLIQKLRRIKIPPEGPIGLALNLFKKAIITENEKVDTIYEFVTNPIMKFISQAKKLPGEVKNRIGSDLDRMINEASPKTPSGGYIEYASFDPDYFKRIKDPQLSDASEDVFQKVKEEYRLCDTIFRDLYYSDFNKYKTLFYPS